MFFPNFVFQEKCDGIRCWCISVVELSLNFDLSRAVHMYNAPAPDDLSRDSMMISTPLVIVLLMYLLGNILSVFSLYILIIHADLHKNFRMAVLLLIVFGFLRAFVIYFLTANDYIEEENLRTDIRDVLLATFVYAICGFAISSLFLSIERCIAVYKPKRYERYSDQVILPATTLTTTLTLTAILGYWANKNSDNQIPLITVTTAAGIVSLFMAIVVWVRAKHLLKSENASLGLRFQVAESNRTSPIYLSISVNESICICAMSVMGLLMIQKENSETMGTSNVLVYLLDACGAWRIIFINFTLIYYSFLAKKIRLAAMAHRSKSAQQATVAHFDWLKEMWN
ncbi:hypothetical protein Y032_0018g3516 [Ancylostoma ceylanicum]|uniref:Uncharacterized protein n=1 Tax=Ancylostoma ceylanicum TaxID=53326 RepID=A0A016V253_9BILA|nr:hypothetical protein Y032_0018g3516 [Ancylostoma ceylanicum]